MIQGSNPFRCKIIISCTKRPDPLPGPLSLLFSCWWWLFSPQINRPGCETTHLRISPWLRIRGAIPSLPVYRRLFLYRPELSPESLNLSVSFRRRVGGLIPLRVEQRWKFWESRFWGRWREREMLHSLIWWVGTVIPRLTSDPANKFFG